MATQSGNFTNDRNDTFDETKHYIGVRLQQGVPLLDRDWNELEDIRRFEEMMLRKWYIGNGTPDNGFEITKSGSPNDFNISPGRYLIDGFEAVNDSPTSYLGQVDKITDKTWFEEDKLINKSLAAGKKYIVYIDLWIAEISGKEDKRLNNSDENLNKLNIETSRRHKVVWIVQAREENENTRHEEFHNYYDIARIDIAADGQMGTPTDLRRTGLALYQLVDASNPIVKALKADKSGNIGIGLGTDNPATKLHVAGQIHSGGMAAGLSFANQDAPNNGAFVANGGDGQTWVWLSKGKTARLWSGSDKVLVDSTGDVHARSFQQTSDVRLKANIAPLSGVLERLDRIRGVSFEWNDLGPSGSSGGRKEIGLIAQEVEEVFPELVAAWGDEGYLGIDYSRLTGVLVEAIKELKAKNEASDREIKELKNALSVMRGPS